VAACACLLLSAGPLFAQKTDVVRLANGDRFTGEVKSVKKGQLQLSTDDAGTIYLEWIKVASLESIHRFDVTVSDGRRFYGTLAAGDPRTLIVRETTGDVTLSTVEITEITPIGAGFWKRLDGSLDLGFSYTRSSDIAQLSMNSSTVFRVPAFEARLDASATLTQNANDGARDDRGAVQASYYRFRGQHLFLGGGGGFESNESLGLILRSQIAGVVGARLVHSNRAQLATGAGIAVNNEQNVDADPTKNVEGILTFRTSYYAYDRPRTNFDLAIQYYPSLSNWGRQRIQFNTSARREIFSDVFLSISVFDTFDSRPPTAEADRNDVGVALSFGWTY
jgi:uncharacterized protein DUF481